MSKAEADYATEICTEAGPRWAELQEDLADSDIAIPLNHRWEWAKSVAPGRSDFVAVVDRAGKCCCGFAVETVKSRWLPGHGVLKVDRFGSALDTEARSAAISALVGFARERRGIDGVRVRVFSADEQVRRAAADGLSRSGFRRPEAQHYYNRTVAVDLRVDNPEVFDSFHKTCRRHIRAPAKKGLVVAPLDDPAYGSRMAQLERETMTRTGGTNTSRDWSRIVAFSRENPDLSRIVGTLQPDLAGPDSLLSFAWGSMNGDCATYEAAATTRHASVNVALSYAPAWELIQWAQGKGAEWFDFGGITDGTHEGDDPTGGISDFKRYFSKEVTWVAEEWVLEMRPIRARIREAARSVAGWAGRSLNRLR
jgi:hypothetical protein